MVAISLMTNFIMQRKFGVLNDPLLLRIGELLLYIWKQVFVIVILINTVQRYFFYFIEQNIFSRKWIIQNR